MKLRKYKKMLNKSRHGWIWFPWIRAQDIDGRRVAYLMDDQIGNSWGFRVVCSSLVGVDANEGASSYVSS